MFAPSLKAISGRGGILSNFPRRGGAQRGTPGLGLGNSFRPTKRGSGAREMERHQPVPSAKGRSLEEAVARAGRRACQTRPELSS